MPSSLTGIRIVDLTQVLNGPFCTMLLADVRRLMQEGFSRDFKHRAAISPAISRLALEQDQPKTILT